MWKPSVLGKRICNYVKMTILIETNFAAGLVAFVTPETVATPKRSPLGVLAVSMHVYPLHSSDCKPQLCKPHILANSSIDATIQRWIAGQVLAVLKFHRSLTKARLQSGLMEGGEDLEKTGAYAEKCTVRRCKTLF